VKLSGEFAGLGRHDVNVCFVSDLSALRQRSHSPSQRHRLTISVCEVMRLTITLNGRFLTFRLARQHNKGIDVQSTGVNLEPLEPQMKNSHSRLIASAFLATALAGCGLIGGGSDSASEANYVSPSSETYMRSSPTGDIFTTPSGRTVYTYDSDSAGVSNCYDACAEEWPPVTAPRDAQPVGNMTIIERRDGTRQWAYNGKPLYLYHDDKAAGDVTGDNEGGVWHVVR
jgi:predicted lipoprotein with Yx(FWY)xxD motif